jgi:hypothetical protein
MRRGRLTTRILPCGAEERAIAWEVAPTASHAQG